MFSELALQAHYHLGVELGYLCAVSRALQLDYLCFEYGVAGAELPVALPAPLQLGFVFGVAGAEIADALHARRRFFL